MKTQVVNLHTLVWSHNTAFGWVHGSYESCKIAHIPELSVPSSLLNNPCIGGLFSGTFLTDFQSLLLPLETLLIFDESKQKCSYVGRVNDKKIECF